MDISNQSQGAPDASTANPAESAAPLTDLDGLSKFTFQGEELTPDRLAEVMTGYKTLSEKQESFAKEEKFIKNLDADLDNVLQDPRLAEKFKQVYPKTINGINVHALLDKMLRDNRQSAAPQNNTQQQSALPKEFMDEFGQMKQRLQFHEQRAYDAEVQANLAKLDSITPPLFKKYPLAIEDQVYSRADALVSQGQKLTEKTWERLIRESHETFKKRADGYHSEQLKTQIEKGQRGADVGPGGATPGQAPVKPRTFAEAEQAMLASLKRAR